MRTIYKHPKGGRWVVIIIFGALPIVEWNFFVDITIGGPVDIPWAVDGKVKGLNTMSVVAIFAQAQSCTD